MNQPAQRQRRSEKLTPEEHAAYKAWVDSFDTKLDALEVLPVSRFTLNSTYSLGTGHPATIAKIRALIGTTVQ